MTARPIRRNAQTPDRNGKIFYTFTTSLSHISKVPGHEAVDGQRRGSHRHPSGYPVLRPLWLNQKTAVGAGNPTKWCKPLDYIDMCNISTILLLYIYDIISTIENPYVEAIFCLDGGV